MTQQSTKAVRPIQVEIEMQTINGYGPLGKPWAPFRGKPRGMNRQRIKFFDPPSKPRL